MIGTLRVDVGQKYCRIHSAILPTFIKLPAVIKIFVLSIYELQFYTGFTVYAAGHNKQTTFSRQKIFA